MKLRLGTYNLKNLFGVTDSSWPKPTAELKALAGTLDRVMPDVLALQEVGSLDSLEALNDRLQTPFPHAGLIEGNSDRGIHLAMLSRFPMRLTSHKGEALQIATGEPLLEHPDEASAAEGVRVPLGFQRDLLLAEIDLPGVGTMAVFSVHLKSKTNREWRSQPAEVVRLAESELVARKLTAYLDAHPDRPVFLVGDFNDTRHGQALAPIFGLPLVDLMGEVLAGSGRNPSTYWPRRRMRIDFLLANRPGVRQVVRGSTQIHISQRARRGSDHYPVTVDLALSLLQPALPIEGEGQV